MLKSKRKHLISSAMADNRRPQRSRSSGDLLLPLDGDKRFKKLQQRGKTTPAGRFFSVKLKQALIHMTLKGQSSKEGTRSIS